MRRQENGNRNFTYGTYDTSSEEDIISPIPAGAGEYALPENFTESAALSILQNRRDVLFAKSIMENTGGLAFMASNLAVYARKSLQQMMERR